MSSSISAPTLTTYTLTCGLSSYRMFVIMLSALLSVPLFLLFSEMFLRYLLRTVIFAVNIVFLHHTICSLNTLCYIEKSRKTLFIKIELSKWVLTNLALKSKKDMKRMTLKSKRENGSIYIRRQTCWGIKGGTMGGHVLQEFHKLGSLYSKRWIWGGMHIWMHWTTDCSDPWAWSWYEIMNHFRLDVYGRAVYSQGGQQYTARQYIW